MARFAITLALAILAGASSAPAVEEEKPAECPSCDLADDVHAGQEGPDCGRCHRGPGWLDGVFFDHDLAQFPLLGLHAVSACEQCHLTPRFQDTESACVACHAAEDVHAGRLGGACDDCHNPNGWRFWRYSHEERSGFALGGAHAKLDCHACHQVSTEGEMRMPESCGGCHTGDDVHFGGFGSNCNRCHGDDSWNDVEGIQ